MPGTDYESAINVDICSVVTGGAGGYVPGRSASYETKAKLKGFGSLVSLRFQKDGGAKSKQIWMNLSHWNTGGSGYRCEELLFLKSL